MDLSVILPIYNEKENLAILMDEIHGVLSEQGVAFEVIAVDDGSIDGTRELLEQLATERPTIKAIFLRRNSGQTAAFDSGFRHATGKYLVTMDADLQNDPKDIPKMVSKMEMGFDYVAGWRRHRKDGFVLRTLPSRIANTVIRRVTKTKFHDLGCSLKMYRRELTQELRLYGEMHRFIGVLMESMGARVCEIEVHHRPRHAGESKYGLFRTFKVLLDLLTVWFMKSFRTKPSYVFGGIGIVGLVLSGFLCGFVLWEKYALDVWVHRNPVFLIAVFFGMISVQFFGMGILAELVIRTYFESSQQTPYLVSHRIGFDSEPGRPSSSTPELTS